MDKLDAFKAVCNDLSSSSMTLIAQNLAYIKSIKTQQQSTLAPYNIYDVDKEALIYDMKIKSLEFLSDANYVSTELKTFIVFDLNGFMINDKCEFLYSVWSGDMYGVSGIDALRELHKEIVAKQKTSVVKYIESHIKSTYKLKAVEKKTD